LRDGRADPCSLTSLGNKAGLTLTVVFLFRVTTDRIHKQSLKTGLKPISKGETTGYPCGERGTVWVSVEEAPEDEEAHEMKSDDEEGLVAPKPPYTHNELTQHCSSWRAKPLAFLVLGSNSSGYFLCSASPTTFFQREYTTTHTTQTSPAPRRSLDNSCTVARKTCRCPE